MSTPETTASTRAALAAHRFGLGEARTSTVGSDATGWLLQQLGPAEAQRGNGLASGAEGVKRFAQFLEEQRRNPPAQRSEGMAADTRPAEQQFGEHFRAIVQADIRARWPWPC
jgi:hypothetical protein